MPKSIMRLLAAFGFILCSALPGMAEPTGMPLIAGADTAGGYAGDVLVKVLPAWQPPAGASGIVTISLRIGSALDESACQAVVRAGTLPTPPYGAITEVYLTFMTDPGALKGTAPQGQASAPKERSYAEEIMFRAKPYIQIPQGVHGEYSVELTLRINETGGIEQMSVSKSSGKAEVDNAVLTGVIREGVIPPRPAGSEPLTMRLLFTLKNN